MSNPNNKKKKHRITRKMSSLYRDIQRKKRSERNDLKNIIRTEKRRKDTYVQRNRPILAPPQNQPSQERRKVQAEMGHLKKVRRPEHRISKTHQNLTSYRNRRYGRDIENLKIRNLQKEKYNAQTTLAETTWINDDEPGFIELDESDMVNRTEELTQDDILEELDLNTQKNVFDLSLTGQSGYCASYNTSGRHILLGGLRGHLCALEWRKFKSVFETSNIDHRISSVCWMLDDSLLAVAGKNWQTRIYDCDGAELHCVHTFSKVEALEYLKYHLLLVGGSYEKGFINYLDISLGKTVSRVISDPFLCMTQNPYNALILTGQRDGIVSMWTPRDNPKKPAVAVKCHDGGLTNIMTSKKEMGNLMITTGLDYRIKVWDIRKTYTCISQKLVNFIPEKMAISDNDVLAISQGNNVMTYRSIDAKFGKKDVYLRFQFPHGTITSLDFCPYEDILGIGWTGGFRSVVVPGAGRPELDSRQPNPYFSERQLKNWNVERVIEKIPWEMICLDPRLVGSSGTGQARSLRLRPDIQEKIDGLDFEVIRDEDGELNERFFGMRRDERLDIIRKEKEKDLEGVKVKEWFEEEEKNPLMRFVGKHRKIEIEKERIRKEKEMKILKEVEEQDENENENEGYDDENNRFSGKKRKRDDDDKDDDFSGMNFFLQEGGVKKKRRV